MTANISAAIRWLNVLMTFLVVGLHVVTMEPRLSVVYPLFEMAVPVFFMISAYLYYQNFSFSWLFYKKRLLSRLQSLYIPFVLFNLLYVPYFYIKTSLLHVPNERVLDLLSLDMVTSVLFGYPDVPNNVLWYIRALLQFVLIAPLLGILLKKSRHFFLPIVALGCWLTQYCSYFDLPYWLPFLAVGCYIALYEDSVLHLLRKWQELPYIRLQSGVLFIVYIVCSGIILENKDATSSLSYYVFRLTVPLSIIFFYIFFKSMFPGRIVTAFAPYTFFIYCTHRLFVYSYLHYVSKCLPDIHFVLLNILVFFISLLSVWFLALLVSRVRPVWRVLTGGRKTF